MTAIDLRERQYVSQWATDLLGLSIIKLGVPTDVDGDVTVSLYREVDGFQVFSRTADHLAVGLYETQLVPDETSISGFYTVLWTYAMETVEQEYRSYIEIGEANAAYDFLVPAMKDIVDTCWVRFADLFDSPGSGPNLMTYFQTHFGRGRMAQLLRIAVGTLNTIAQPFQTYTIDGDGGASFPIDRWGALLERSLYVESLRHLIRSYAEQPMFVGGSVTRLDRRDYMDRWNIILGMEEPVFQRQLEVFKIGNMGLGKPAVLVAGGVYGRYGPTRVAGSVAARPRMWTRWY
jgi:hypothetical protein